MENKIGERMRTLRNERNLSLSGLAKETNIGKSTLASYESRGVTPRSDNAQKLADYFEVSVPYLMGLSDYKNNFDREKELNMIALLERIYSVYSKRYNALQNGDEKAAEELSKELEMLQLVQMNIENTGVWTAEKLTSLDDLQKGKELSAPKKIRESARNLGLDINQLLGEDIEINKIKDELKKVEHKLANENLDEANYNELQQIQMDLMDVIQIKQLDSTQINFKEFEKYLFSIGYKIGIEHNLKGTFISLKDGVSQEEITLSEDDYKNFRNKVSKFIDFEFQDLLSTKKANKYKR